MKKRVTYIFDEDSSKYLPVLDKTQNFKTSAVLTSASNFKKKRLLQRTNNVVKRPVPGGVGFGTFYKNSAHVAFSDYSSLDFGILTPPFVGGNSEKDLYLTATNGTAKGVEALVHYKGQNEPVFRIYDWAKPDVERWSMEIPCRSIPENFMILPLNNFNHSFCRVNNETRMVSPGVWENKVYLLNFQGNNWDLIYVYQYLSTLEDQRDDFYGSWGPIIETFQETFTEVNPLGFYNARLYNNKIDDFLKPSNSTTRDDMNGLDIRYRVSNHTFYVT